MPQRSIVHVSVGDDGCRMGNELWDLLAKEHGVDFGGFSVVPKGDIGFSFIESNSGRYVPRAVMEILKDGE